MPRTGADPFNWARDVEALLRERHTASHTVHEVRLPDGVSVTALVEMATDPERLARRLRRPVPAPPTTQARRGTRFHAWLERFFAGEPLLDINELPGASDSAVVDEEVELLRARFLSSRWAARSPAEIELPFTTSISGVTVRGRVDAVFGDSDGGCTVVDWKTGSAPRSDRSAAVAVQLAVYRLAVADILGLSLDLVRAGFHYVAQDRWAAPVDLLDGAGSCPAHRDRPSAGGRPANTRGCTHRHGTIVVVITVLEYLVIAAAIAAVVFVVAVFVFGRGERMAPLPAQTSPAELPDRGITAQDVHGVKFAMALRGYRMSDVDWTLERLALRIDELTKQVVALQAETDPDGISEPAESDQDDLFDGSVSEHAT